MLNVRQRYRFASSLAAALLDGLFAHPAGYSDTDTARELIATYCATIEFFRSLLGSPFEHDDFRRAIYPDGKG